MSAKVTDLPAGVASGAVFYAVDGTTDSQVTGGAANGVATLGADGRVPSAQLSVDALEYKGAWNASTNTPTLANGSGTPGDTYAVSVSGTQNLGGGSELYSAGDMLIYNGTTWDHISSSNPATPANPTATVALAAKNGTAPTFMRSDGAPALDQTIAPTWTGAHTFSQTMTTAAITASGMITSTAGVAGNTSVKAGIGSNSVQMDGAPNGSDPVIQALGATDANVSIEMKAKGSGLLKFTSSATFSGNLNVAGQLGSAANTSAPSPTNSGITMGGAPTWAMQSFYDQSVTVNNRTADLLFITNSLKFRFANDARSAFLDVLSINGGQALGVTGITSTSGSGAWAHTGNMTVSGTLTANGAALTGVVGSDAKLAQSADVNVPSAYSVTASGTYRVSTYIVMTRAATTSATLPGVNVTYVEATTSVGMSDISTLSAGINQVGAHSGGSVVIQAQQGSTIGYVTSSYASAGATTMQYEVRVVIERLL